MGDVVLTTLLLRCLRKLSDIEIHFLTKIEYQDILLHNPHIDRLLCFDGDLKETARRLRKNQYDYIIDLHKNLRSYALRTMLTRSTLSFDKKTWQTWIYFQTGLNKPKYENRAVSFLNSASRLGVVNDGEGLDFFMDPDAKAPVSSSQIDVPQIALVMGGTYSSKRIPDHVIEAIIQNDSFHFHLLGGKDVSNYGKGIERSNVTNHVNRTNLHESARVLEMADLVVTGDTGLMHVAAALRKRILVIWAGTAPILGYYPYFGETSGLKHESIEVKDLDCRPCSKYGRNSCPKKHFNCLKMLDTVLIQKKIEDMISSNHRRLPSLEY